MNTLYQDMNFGLHMLAKNPGFTLVAVLAMALGIGADTSIFTTVNAMLLHPLPFERLDRLVAVYETAPKQNEDHAAVAPQTSATSASKDIRLMNLRQGMAGK